MTQQTQQQTAHPVPSDRARELVRGAYDTHIHVAPDVMERSTDDVDLARRCLEVGLAGFVLKSHYVPTAERAAVVRKAVPGVEALGAITLNASVGGLNPVAVEIAGRQGARVVWMPTVDSLNQRRSRAQDPPGAKPPMWAAVQDGLRDQGMEADPVLVVDERGRPTKGCLDLLKLVAQHGMTLATGHLASDEIIAVVEAAVDAGVRQVVVTHPEFTSQRLSVEVQQRLAAKGALLERCFTTPHTGKVEWDEMLRNIRAVGPEHSVLSSDLGQPFNPPVEDGLPLMADTLLENGFDEDEVVRMARTNTLAVAGVEITVTAR
jgi:sugar phosphate isomerase/epimerase